MENKIKKSLPKSETLWETQTFSDGDQFYITSTNIRDKYLLYRKVKGGYTLISTSKTPMKLHELVVINHNKTKGGN